MVALAPLELGDPRIHENNTGIFEMCGIPGGYGGVTCKGNAGDHRIARVDRAAFFTPHGHEFTSSIRSLKIETENSISNITKHAVETFG